jgi:hypothetical protein
MHSGVAKLFREDPRLQHITHVYDPGHKSQSIRKALRKQLVEGAYTALGTRRIAKATRAKYKQIASNISHSFAASLKHAKKLYCNNRVALRAEYAVRIQFLEHHTTFRHCPDVCICNKQNHNISYYNLYNSPSALDSIHSLFVQAQAAHVGAIASGHHPMDIEHAHDVGRPHGMQRPKLFLDGSIVADRGAINAFDMFLESEVLAPAVLEDFVHKYTTSPVESFHAVMRKFAPSRIEYWKHYDSLLHFCLLHHNHKNKFKSYLFKVYQSLNLPVPPVLIPTASKE